MTRKVPLTCTFARDVWENMGKWGGSLKSKNQPRDGGATRLNCNHSIGGGGSEEGGVWRDHRKSGDKPTKAAQTVVSPLRRQRRMRREVTFG